MMYRYLAISKSILHEKEEIKHYFINILMRLNVVVCNNL